VELGSENPFNFVDQEFDLPGPVQKISSLGSGHIHDTYLIACGDQASSRFVLQKFNDYVFRNPQQVAANIWLVLDHVLKTKSDPEQTLHILKTKDDSLLYHSDNGDYWRVFNYISGSDSFEQVTHPDQAFGAASAFGTFIRLLNGLDPQQLFTTIPDFHNLEVRFKQLKNALDADPVKRSSQYQEEVEFAADRQNRVAEYSMRVTKSGVPLRITHNDTKISNVLFKKGTTSAICVIDLDTVMPGLLLYDFGDMARTFCNSILEDEEAHQAEIRLDIFKALC
jgi:Ser/Thr protein kinase RdoA (MazF antagonist)